MIDVTLIGTSALLPLPDRALTAALLTVNGRSILFDCGEGTQSAARRAGVSLMKTDLIALTHYHGDHVFGLPGLLQTMGVLERTEPLYITGPEGLADELSPILFLAGRTGYDIRLIELPEGGLALRELAAGWPSGAVLKAFQTEHTVLSRGYCFTLGRAGRFMPEKAEELEIPKELWSVLQRGESVSIGEKTFLPEQVMGEARKGLKFVFSGDTRACGALTEAAKDADLMICDATYGENDQAELAADHGHMNFAQAAECASKAGVKELWLAHYSQMIGEPGDHLSNAAEIFANTVCGRDGMRKTLRFGDCEPHKDA